MLLLRTSRGVDPGIPLLRSLGTSAHVWLPGASGVSVASLPSNNYLLSDGSTGYSTVDGVDGLTLDGMGALGSEKTTNGTFDSGITDWYGPSATTLSWSAGQALSTAGNTKLGIAKTMSFVTGSTYVVTAMVTNNAGAIAFSVYSDTSYTSIIATSAATTANVASPITIIFVAPVGLTAFVLAHNSGAVSTGKTAYFDNISVKEYTGTHLTQPTTANKPIVRRGMLNLLTYSRDFTTGWTNFGATLTAGQTDPYGGTTATLVNQTAGGSMAKTTTAVVAGNVYTACFICKQGSSTKTGIELNGGVVGNLIITHATLALAVSGALSGATVSDLGSGWLLVAAKSTAATTTNVGTYAYGDGDFGGPTGSSYFCGIGLTLGTWTAAQILAEGGIPTTTATAASNPSAGKYWWSFDGSNDSLLSGNLGITNACTIVIAGRLDAVAGLTYRSLLEEAVNGVSVYVAANGSVLFSKAAVVALVTSSAGTIVAGVPFVLTVRLSGGTVVIRLNGVQIATAATALSFAATTGARIGTDFAGGSWPVNGAIGWVVPIAAALSDADCLTVERLVGQQFPGMATF